MWLPEGSKRQTLGTEGLRRGARVAGQSTFGEVFQKTQGKNPTKSSIHAIVVRKHNLPSWSTVTLNGENVCRRNQGVRKRD